MSQVRSGGIPMSESVQPVGTLMRSPDIMSDLGVIRELVALTEEHIEHDIELTPELVREVKMNTWFESDVTTRHYILIHPHLRCVVSCKLIENNWMPCSMSVVADDVAHTFDMVTTMTSNVIAVRVLASQLQSLMEIFKFIIDKAPPGGVAMTRIKNARHIKRPPPKKRN